MKVAKVNTVLTDFIIRGNLKMFKKIMIVCLWLTVSLSIAQNANHLELRNSENGVRVSFVSRSDGNWHVEISNETMPRLIQEKPVQLEILKADENILNLSSEYKAAQQSSSGIDAEAEIVYNKNVTFKVHDIWSLSGQIISIKRNVEIIGNAPGGFNSSIVFSVDPSVKWTDVNCFVPGALYGDPTYDGDRSPGGTLNYAAKQFIMREDILPAPMFALSFKNGFSVAMLDPTPNGESTVEETKIRKNVRNVIKITRMMLALLTHIGIIGTPV